MIVSEKYKDYKESGIEWLGKIPAHWQVTKLKRYCDIQLGKMLQPQPNAATDIQVPYLKAAHVQWGRIDNSELPEMWASEKEVAKFQVSSGDLLVCEGGEVGRSAILGNVKGICIIQNALHRIRGNQSTFVPFINYLMRHIADTKWFDILCNKATIAHLTGEKLGAIDFPLPTLEEQKAIARFLDFKTAQIDALIAKKQALLDKLAEKRTALISHAVTKGLDPSAPMKDSGVAWLGEIPAHWGVIALRYACEFLNWRRIPLSSEERGAMSERVFPYYGASGIIDYVENYIFDDKTILIAEDGANLLSRSTPLAFIADGKYWVNNHAHILKPTRGPFEFWADLLCVVNYDPWITGSAQPKLSKENLGGIKLPLPPEHEQSAIVKFISEHSRQIDPMVNKVSLAIKQLEEYRSALITNAVTGKIDVRNWQPNQETA